MDSYREARIKVMATGAKGVPCSIHSDSQNRHGHIWIYFLLLIISGVKPLNRRIGLTFVVKQEEYTCSAAVL